MDQDRLAHRSRLIRIVGVERDERPSGRRVKVGYSMTPLKYVPLRWVAGVVILLAAFVYLAGLTASPDDASIAYQTIAAVALVSILTALIVFCVLAQRRYVGTPLVDWPGWRRFFLEMLIAAPVAIGWMLALSMLAGLSPELRRLTNPREAIYKPVIIAPVIYSLAGFTLGPVAEEMLYRAVLYRTLRRWVRPFFAVVLQALVFGVLHRYGLPYMAMAFASGLLFMGLYLWRRTLWSPILVHALTNAVGAISLLVLLLSASSDVVLGVTMADGEGQPGSRVMSVAPGSPAQEANLQVGDVITAIDHRAIHHVNDVRKFVENHERGDAIHLTFIRGGQTFDTVAELRIRRPHILW